MTVTHFASPGPRVMIVFPSGVGPKLYPQPSALDALNLLQHWIDGDCATGVSIWIRKGRQWLPATECFA